MFGRVGFFQDVQLEIFVANLRTADTVPARRFAFERGECIQRLGRVTERNNVKRNSRLTSFRVQVAKTVVAHLVHQAVEQRRRTFFVDPELALRRVVVGFLDVLAFFRAAADSHHPQELVDV